MTIFHSIILGVVEGITEFLPISSTGHLILTSKLLSLGESDFLKSFEIIIQLGAILAVVVLYWHKLRNWEMIKKIFVAFLPTAIIGLALYKIVKTYLLGSVAVVLWSLLIGGAAIIIFELWYQRKSNHLEVRPPSGGNLDIRCLSYKQAFSVGLFQSIAIIPGVSRSASTIIGGLFMGLSRKMIVEFSFLLAVPTMLAASGLDLVKNYQTFSQDDFLILLVGFVVSFLVAVLSIKLLLAYVQKYNFIPFGIYRILISLFFWFLVLK